MTDLGNLSLLFMLVLSGFAAIAGLCGGLLVRPRLVRAAERALVAAWGLCATSMVVLWVLLFQSNFRIEYVWGHSNRDLSTFYKITSLWSGQEGSLLLWTFVVLTYGLLVVLLNRRRNRTLMPYVVAVIASSALFFSLLNVFVANPFNEIAFVHTDGRVSALPNPPPDGKGLNPLLQHPAMGIHPPILYAGYVGFLVPFAFCIAALITRQLGNAWIGTIRRWTLSAWLLQGSGILLGGRWAYVELGWGGYWAWDPVENASFLPWLIATAFLHSVMIQEKRGMLKIWNVGLVLATYGLSIWGTFTTRSGIMSSVHAFAQSSIGSWFVVYLGLIVILTTALLLTRLDHLKSENRFEDILSRESAFLFNNMLFVLACFAVLWGTMFPVISEWWTGEKIVVGIPFFNRVMVPLGLMLLFLTGVGPLLAWRKTSTRTLVKVFAQPATVAVLAAGCLVAFGIRHVYAVISLSLCAFVTTTIVMEFYRGGRARGRSIGAGFFAGLIDLTRRNNRRYGGYIVHFAFVLLFVGFTGKAFDTETKVSIKTGDVISLRGYDLHVGEIVADDLTDPNFAASRATLRLTRGGKELATLVPESRFYRASEQSTTEVARWGNLREDVYAVFVRGDDDRSPQIQLFINPLIRWVWIGGFLMAFGTLFTMLPPRRSVRPRTQVAGTVREPAHV